MDRVAIAFAQEKKEDELDHLERLADAVEKKLKKQETKTNEITTVQVKYHYERLSLYRHNVQAAFPQLGYPICDLLAMGMLQHATPVQKSQLRHHFLPLTLDRDHYARNILEQFHFYYHTQYYHIE